MHAHVCKITHKHTYTCTYTHKHTYTDNLKSLHVYCYPDHFEFIFFFFLFGGILMSLFLCQNYKIQKFLVFLFVCLGFSNCISFTKPIQ